MAKANDYDAVTKVTVREIRGEQRFTVGNADDETPGLSGTVEAAVQVSEFVEATLTHVVEEQEHSPEAFEDGETVGVYGIRDRRPEDSDAETAVRDYEEVEVEEVEL
jgi:hypothetical protein